MLVHPSHNSDHLQTVHHKQHIGNAPDENAFQVPKHISALTANNTAMCIMRAQN